MGAPHTFLNFTSRSSTRYPQWTYVKTPLKSLAGEGEKTILSNSRAFCSTWQRLHSGKESASQCRRFRRLVFSPWVGKIPWSRKWQPSPVFLPGKFYGKRSLVGYSPWGHKESDTAEQLSTQARPQGKQFYQSLTYLGAGRYPSPATLAFHVAKGKYPTPAILLHHSGGNWEGLVKFITPRYSTTLRVIAPNLLLPTLLSYC